MRSHWKLLYSAVRSSNALVGHSDASPKSYIFYNLAKGIRISSSRKAFHFNTILSYFVDIMNVSHSTKSIMSVSILIQQRIPGLFVNVWWIVYM